MFVLVVMGGVVWGGYLGVDRVCVVCGVCGVFGAGGVGRVVCHNDTVTI